MMTTTNRIHQAFGVSVLALLAVCLIALDQLVGESAAPSAAMPAG